MQVQSLGWEDLLEQEMTIHYSILAWKFYGQRSLVGCSLAGHKGLDMTEHTHTNIYLLNKLQLYAAVSPSLPPQYTHTHTHTQTHTLNEKLNPGLYKYLGLVKKQVFLSEPWLGKGQTNQTLIYWESKEGMVRVPLSIYSFLLPLWQYRNPSNPYSS